MADPDEIVLNGAFSDIEKIILSLTYTPCLEAEDASCASEKEAK